MPGQFTAGVAMRVEIGGAVTLEDVEAEHVRRVTEGAASFEDAASILGIDPSTLYRKRKKAGKSRKPGTAPAMIVKSLSL